MNFLFKTRQGAVSSIFASFHKLSKQRRAGMERDNVDARVAFTEELQRNNEMANSETAFRVSVQRRLNERAMNELFTEANIKMEELCVQAAKQGLDRASISADAWLRNGSLMEMECVISVIEKARQLGIGIFIDESELCGRVRTVVTFDVGKKFATPKIRRKYEY